MPIMRAPVSVRGRCVLPGAKGQSLTSDPRPPIRRPARRQPRPMAAPAACPGGSRPSGRDRTLGGDDRHQGRPVLRGQPPPTLPCHGAHDAGRLPALLRAFHRWHKIDELRRVRLCPSLLKRWPTSTHWSGTGDFRGGAPNTASRTSSEPSGRSRPVQGGRADRRPACASPGP